MSTAELFRLRLETYSLDEPNVVDPFSARLARENGWSVPYAERVIHEYKRFVLLAEVAGHPVTPSDPVDQAWHLHITYTRSYQRFCKEVLGRKLHHEPSRGGTDECLKFRSDYKMTLEAYRRTFEEPEPDDIWPSVERRFGDDQHFVRVSPKAAFIVPKRALILAFGIGVAVSAGLAITLPPLLALRGPEFLGVLVAISIVGLGAAWLVREWPHYRAPSERIELDPYEAAYLEGGEPAVASAALAQLTADGTLVFEPDNVTLSAQKPLPDSAHPVERAVYERAQGRAPVTSPPATLPMVYAAAATAGRDVGTRLRGLGLVGRSSSLPLVLALVAPAIGVTKLVTGLFRGQPVFLLVVLIALAIIVAVRAFRPQAARTPRGRAALERLKAENAELRAPRALNKALPEGGVSLAVGLFGLSVLPALELGQFSIALGTTHRNAQSLNAGACGGGGCGGGDGGDGGCGGGCGGCGGCG